MGVRAFYFITSKGKHVLVNEKEKKDCFVAEKKEQKQGMV